MKYEVPHTDDPRFLGAIAAADTHAEKPNGYLLPDALSGLPKETPLLLGFSGGIDSSVLLFLSYVYAKQSGAPLRLVHLHHGIRGEEADRDADFAERIADCYGLPISIVRRDVPRIAAERGESLETAARRVRYEVFCEVLREHRIPILLTAHNADDNLETVLFHLLRGSGLSGLSGIPARRATADGMLLRPLLRVSRADIEAFREKYAIPAIFDSTNDDVSYTRNRLRKEIVPVMRRIVPSPERAAERMTASLSRDRAFLDRLAREARARAETAHGISRAALESEDDAIVLRVLLAYWKDAVPGLDSYESVHLDALLAFFRTGRDKTHLSLPKSTAELRNGYLTVSCGTVRSTGTPPAFALPLPLGETVDTPVGVSVRASLCEECRSDPQKQNIYNSATQIHIPFDTIDGVCDSSCLTVRSRLPGDRILLRGMHRSLRTLLNEAGLSAEERARLVIIARGQEILWIPGLAVSDRITRAGGTGGGLSVTLSGPSV